MIKVTGVETNGSILRANGLLGDAQVFIDYHKVTGEVKDSTFNVNSDLFKAMDKEVRNVVVFKVSIEMNSNLPFTVRQLNQLHEWHDKLYAAEKVLEEMDLLIDEEDWLTLVFGQTAGSIQDAIAEARIAVDVRLSDN